MHIGLGVKRHKWLSVDFLLLHTTFVVFGFPLRLCLHHSPFIMLCYACVDVKEFIKKSEVDVHKDILVLSRNLGL